MLSYISYFPDRKRIWSWNFILRINYFTIYLVLFINIMIAYLLCIIILEKRLCLAISHYLSISEGLLSELYM